MATVKSLQMEARLEQKVRRPISPSTSPPASPPGRSATPTTSSPTASNSDDARHPDRRRLLVMQNDGFTVGMLVAFQMFASRMSQPLLRLVGLWQEFQQANIAVKRLGDILDMPQEPHALTPQREPRAGNGRIDPRPGLPLRRAAPLALPPPRPGLQARPPDRDHGPLGLRQEHAGQAAARLLSGPGRSDRISTAATSATSPPTNCAAFGVVPQETVLFSGTLYDNLVMAHPHASFEDVIAACKAAEIHEVIEKLPPATRPRSANAAPASRAASAAHRHRPGAAQAAEDPDLRRSGVEPRSADRRALRPDDQQAQGQGDDAVHHPPDSARAAGR
jgi:subfamily B ATP-binding cassette protein HlyB/CyaB